MSDQGEEGEGPRLIRAAAAPSLSLAGRAAARISSLAWRTPLHAARLRGRPPLKLLAAPVDPVEGDPVQGGAILSGQRRVASEDNERDGCFGWLRDLAAAAGREEAAPVAQAAVRAWIGRHGAAVDAAWRPDHWGRRALNWTSHAPLVLSGDAAYRGDVLRTLARGARHVDRTADTAPPGVPRIAAWAGATAAALLLPGQERRLTRSEAGLRRALALGTSDDGGTVSRCGGDLVDLIELLSQLRATYEARGRTPPAALGEGLARGVPALLGLMLGDGHLSSWQGSGPGAERRIAAAVAASGVRARPLRRSNAWGYQRLAAGGAIVVMDCAPPPPSGLAEGGCASTLAFEMSDGAARLIVNCGGDARLPAELRDALRSTAAHSTLVVADMNSTAIHRDGSLGRGVGEVEIDRREEAEASVIEASHDGYARRLGYHHHRRLALSADGRTLDGKDRLEAGGRAKPSPFVIRFHLGPRVEPIATADGQGALLRVEGGHPWQFRCRGAALVVEDSLWVDGAGRPVPTQQLVLAGEAGAGGAAVSWTLRRADS